MKTVHQESMSALCVLCGKKNQEVCRLIRKTCPSGCRTCISRTCHGMSVGGQVTSRPCSVQCRYTASTSSTQIDRKSTRLNSSHSQISYAVFCLKKKKKKIK